MIEAVVNTAIRWLTGIACDVDGGALSRVPWQGPLIIAANHINSLEVPIVFTRLRPRPVTGFAKAETWDNPILRPLFNLWGAIPLERGQADMGAIRAALRALQQNQILAVAPEGTRSSDGQLGQGKPGIVTLALRSGAPILPLVYFGHEHYMDNVRKFRRTSFNVRVGKPFRLSGADQKLNGKLRQQMVDEIMYQLAELLPPAYRGTYQELAAATQEFIEFL
ncbi:MAG: lysophospholipid acyltransferase family protein [Anaerolineales bacterium]